MADKGACIIVGAGPGLGAALARRFAADGHPVVVSARDSARIDGLAKEVTEAGGKALAVAADASSEDQIVALFDQAEQAFGAPAIVVHNVGGRVSKPAVDTTAEDVEGQWRSIAFAGFLVGREAARRMTKAGRGVILFSGGRPSRRGRETLSAFAIAKAGLRAFAECLAREMAPQNVHVAHFAIEGTIGSPRIVAAQPEKAAEEAIISTEALADLYAQTAAQPRSCWTFEVDLRPWSEPY